VPLSSKGRLEQNKPANVVNIIVNNKRTNVLCDTGCSVSCISESFFNALHIPSKALKPSQASHLYAANHSSMRQLGFIDLTLNFNGLFVVHTFAVFRGLSFNIICGIDFMKTHQVVIDCARRIFSMYDNLIVINMTQFIDHATAVVLHRSIKIPPRCEIITQLRVPQQFNKVALILEGRPNHRAPLIGVATAAVLPRNGLSACRMINLSHRPRYLRAGSIIGTIEKCDFTDSINPVTEFNISPDSPTNDDHSEAHSLPAHEERMKHLREIGLKLDNDNLTSDQWEQLSELLYSYYSIELFDSDIKLLASKLIPVKLELTDYTPVHLRQFKQTLAMEQQLQKEIDDLERAGIVSPSTTPWNFPIFIHRKSDQSFRVLTDLRKLNIPLKKSYWPLPNLDATLRNISIAAPKYYSLIDMKASYFQLNLDEDSRSIVGVSSQNGHYAFNRILQGCANSSIEFCFRISQLLHSDMGRHLTVHVDDILIYTDNFKRHVTTLKRIFEQFRENVLRFNPHKSQFGLSQVNYMGFTLTPDGIEVSKKRFSTIESFKPARSITEQDRF